MKYYSVLFKGDKYRITTLAKQPPVKWDSWPWFYTTNYWHAYRVCEALKELKSERESEKAVAIMRELSKEGLVLSGGWDR